MVRHAFMVAKGSEIPTLVEVFGEVRILPLDEEDPAVILVNKYTLHDVKPDEIYIVLISSEHLITKKLEAPREEAEEKEEAEIVTSEEERRHKTSEELFEKFKWTLSEVENKLPFTIVDIKLEYEKEYRMWQIIVRLEKKENISISIAGASKLLSTYLLKVMEEVKFPEPIILVVSMEGKVLYMIVDLVLNDILKMILNSKGLTLRDYVVLLDIANDIIDVSILAEKSPDAKVGIFSGYKVAEEIGKVVKERLKWKRKVRVKLKVGLFDYVKVL